MKSAYSLSFAILSLFAVASCKNSDVDPREQYVGSYNITAAVAVKQGTYNASTVDKYNLTVSKGSAANELTFTDPGATYTVTLSGNTFDVPAYTSSRTESGSNYAVKTVGNGSFNGNAVIVNYTASSYANNQTTTWVWTGNGVKYK